MAASGDGVASNLSPDCQSNFFIEADEIITLLKSFRRMSYAFQFGNGVMFILLLMIFLSGDPSWRMDMVRLYIAGIVIVSIPFISIPWAFNCAFSFTIWKCLDGKVWEKRSRDLIILAFTVAVTPIVMSSQKYIALTFPYTGLTFVVVVFSSVFFRIRFASMLELLGVHFRDNVLIKLFRQVRMLLIVSTAVAIMSLIVLLLLSDTNTDIYNGIWISLGLAAPIYLLYFIRGLKLYEVGCTVLEEMECNNQS